jgi:hypothetical protein
MPPPTDTPIADEPTVAAMDEEETTEAETTDGPMLALMLPLPAEAETTDAETTLEMFPAPLTLAVMGCETTLAAISLMRRPRRCR